MEWITTLSQSNSFEKAVQECVSSLAGKISDLGPPDLAFLFISPRTKIPSGGSGALLYKTLQAKVLIGCSAGGIIGNGKEIENNPGISLTCAWLPEVEISPFQLLDKDLPDLESPPADWRKLIRGTTHRNPDFILLSDPFSFRIEHFLAGLDYAFPSSAKIGGLASGGQISGENLLLFNSEEIKGGLVGIALSGNIIMDAIVSQGCRPIGKPMTVTASQDLFLVLVDGRSPLQVLEEIYESSPQQDRSLIRDSLFLGIGVDHSQETFEMGDFLIRNIIGVDSKKGEIGIASPPRPGQIVQFHLRDARTASEELHFMLNRYASGNNPKEAMGALLFSCLGRGAHLYGSPNHDTDLFLKKVGNLPLGGFFCNGEIGPIAGTTYLHGYTSSFGIFRPRYHSAETIQNLSYEELAEG